MILVFILSKGELMEETIEELEYQFPSKGNYKHNKTGDIYDVIHTNIIDTTNISNNRVMILYKKINDSKLFVRDAIEFYQKFTPII